MSATTTLKNPRYEGRVTASGGYVPDEDIVFNRAEITILGDMIALGHADDTSRRFKRYDTIENATVEESKKGVLTFTGASSLLTEQGLSPADAQVTWVMRPKGCNC